MSQTIAPTRSNLLKLKDDLAFANLGHELLDQKRSILVVELLTLVDQAVDYQNRVDIALEKASASLQNSVMQMGRLKVANVFPSVTSTSSIDISQRKVMGVRLPKVNTTFTGNGPFFSPEGTTLAVEDTISCYQEAIQLMGHLAELKVSIMRLAREVKKSIRKVNALEKIVIPSLEENVKYTAGRIEEVEREGFILMKQVKKRLDIENSKRKKEEQ
ncbi:MAG: V-type ATP synthase subunit D [Sphaerochaetaceae bacterium]